MALEIDDYVELSSVSIRDGALVHADHCPGSVVLDPDGPWDTGQRRVAAQQVGRESQYYDLQGACGREGVEGLELELLELGLGATNWIAPPGALRAVRLGYDAFREVTVGWWHPSSVVSSELDLCWATPPLYGAAGALRAQLGASVHVAEVQIAGTACHVGTCSKRLRWHAALLGRAVGARSVVAHALMLRPDGLQTDSATLQGLELATAEAWGRTVVARVEQARRALDEGRLTDALRRGSWCAYCPAMWHCPRYLEAITKLLEIIPDPRNHTALAESVMHLERAARDTRAALLSYVSPGYGVRLRDGSRVTVEVSKHPVVDARAHYRELREILGPDVADQVLVVALDQSEQTIAKIAKITSMTEQHARDLLLGRLSRAGKISYQKRKRLVHRPKDPAA